jgi:type VI secretion system protein ImpG
MDERLLSYYSNELRFIREMAAEFAHEFPKIAGRLALDPDAKEICPDPYVERLLEGFAFLAARVHLKLDSEFPRFTQTLLETIYPHYLSPIPSMGIAQFGPKTREAGLKDGFVVQRNTRLQSLNGCEFRTAHDVTMWPLRLVAAQYFTRDVVQLKLPSALKARAALMLRIENTAGPLKALDLRQLTFFIRGGDELPVWIYEQIFARATGVVVQSARGDDQELREIYPGSSICRVGFRDNEALLPRGPRSFEGYRLLREFFACPQRFLFFEIAGFHSFVPQAKGNTFEIIIPLREPEPRLENRIDAGSFALYCTPIINLFQKRIEPIDVADRFSEFQVLPERLRPIDFEVFEIRDVVGSESRTGANYRFEPFYRARDTAPREGIYYTVRRTPRVLTAKEKKFGAVSSYAGSDVYVSLVDAKSAPFSRALNTLHVDSLCTNRHLPLQMPLNSGDSDFKAGEFVPVTSIRCISGPTSPVPSVAEGDLSWRTISHLSLNYLSLSDAPDGQGAMALRELLKLYIASNDAFAQRQIEGILSTRSRPIVRRVGGGGPLTFARGLEIELVMDEEAFEGSGIFILGAVLSQFFARYASINSFTETVVISQRRGEIMRWPSLIGKRHVV